MIVLFPSVFWVILELSTINSKKLPYYGPKTLKGKDTVYYQVSPKIKDRIIGEHKQWTLKTELLDTINYPIFAISFIKSEYKEDNFRMAGLSEYAQYKPEKIKEIPFLIITPCDSISCFDEFKKFETKNPNIKNRFWEKATFDSINTLFFIEKPVYIDYSFFVLVDVKRNIRGYYDGRFVSEIKRLTEEYQHLRLKEEKKNIIQSNKIETK